MMQKQSNSRPIPGVMATLAAGFDLTTKHLWLLLLPVLLDGFLWLGPRLSIRPLIEQLLLYWPPDPNLEILAEQMRTLAPQTNLFTFMSIPLIGVPALMAGISPAQTPFAVTVTEVSGLGTWLGYMLVFLLVGLGFTAVFYTLIAQAVGHKGEGLDFLARRISRVYATFLLLGVILFFFLLILYLPITLITFLLSLLSPVLGLLVVFLGMMLVIWLVLAAFFVPQSVALHGRTPLRALQESVLLIRHHGTAVMGLILVYFIGSSVLDQFLLIMDDGSWITGVSILAHAFVSTSLLAATFIFYRDRITISYSLV